ncbi:hypothetical protein CANINC_001534 [Pichia inconspicua]|uniref:Phospholipid/glycerol acyltransferase domain-containing protein n=1 Tax=Pichia inconspicua TaxID=52247 RepID=A0A4T0X3T9_9ASCO|nr:hypothetical protein CANINC_001534 [[Candida] inconspicua]
MEKFTVYSDKTTGIMPFRETPVKVSLLQYLTAVVVLPVRVFLLIILAIVSPIFSVIAPRAYSRTAAYLFGVGSIEFVVDGVRRSDDKGIRDASPVSGDVVVVNAIGPLDYLVWKSTSRFPSVVCVALEDGNIAELGFKDWIDWCFSGSVNICGNVTTFTKLPRDKVIFLVAEGTVTNGKSVIRFPRGFTLNKIARVKTLSTRATPVSCTTVGPTSKISWIFTNMGTIVPSIHYRLKLSIVKEGATDDEIRNTLADNGKMKVIGDSLTVETKRDYLSALEEIKGKNKKRV